MAGGVFCCPWFPRGDGGTGHPSTQCLASLLCQKRRVGGLPWKHSEWSQDRLESK